MVERLYAAVKPHPAVLEFCGYVTCLGAIGDAMELSKTDFEALGLRFKESKHRNEDLEVLRAAIRAQLEKLIRLNPSRADFQYKLEELRFLQ